MYRNCRLKEYIKQILHNKKVVFTKSVLWKKQTTMKFRNLLYNSSISEYSLHYNIVFFKKQLTKGTNTNNVKTILGMVAQEQTSSKNYINYSLTKSINTKEKRVKPWYEKRSLQRQTSKYNWMTYLS